jgi:hypothetical protein
MTGWSRQITDGNQSPRTRRFVKAMQAARRKKDWSRTVMAAAVARKFPFARTDAAVIRNLELGRRATLTLDEAVVIATVLGATVSQLLGEEI